MYNYGLNEKNEHDLLYKKVIFKTCGEAIKKYQSIFTSLHQELKLESINLLKYIKGNFYKKHTDAFHQVNRQLSFIINLNEGYKLFVKGIQKICDHYNKKCVMNWVSNLVTTEDGNELIRDLISWSREEGIETRLTTSYDPRGRFNKKDFEIFKSNVG